MYSASIIASGEATYTIKGSDDLFTTSDIELVNQEESLDWGRKLKEHSVTLVGTFKADSEHGTFLWTANSEFLCVCAKGSEVEHELIQSPELVDEIFEEPTFEIE